MINLVLLWDQGDLVAGAAVTDHVLDGFVAELSKHLGEFNEVTVRSSASLVELVALLTQGPEIEERLTKQLKIVDSELAKASWEKLGGPVTRCQSLLALGCRNPEDCTCGAWTTSPPYQIVLNEPETERGAPGCTCGTPPFAPREPADDCPFHRTNI